MSTFELSVFQKPMSIEFKLESLHMLNNEFEEKSEEDVLDMLKSDFSRFYEDVNLIKAALNEAGIDLKFLNDKMKITNDRLKNSLLMFLVGEVMQINDLPLGQCLKNAKTRLQGLGIDLKLYINMTVV